MRKKQLSSTINGTLVSIIEQAPNKSARLEDLIRKGLLYEEQENTGTGNLLREEVLKHTEAIRELLGVGHICTCNCKEETVKETPQTVEPIKEVKEEETFNVDIPSAYKSGNFRGKLVDSYKDMDGNVVTKGGDILHLCTVNDEAIIVYRVDEHKVAYYFDEFEDAYKGEEVYTSKPNQYNFLKEWGLVD